jgi:hypothetical protein
MRKAKKIVKKETIIRTLEKVLMLWTAIYIIVGLQTRKYFPRKVAKHA